MFLFSSDPLNIQFCKFELSSHDDDGKTVTSTQTQVLCIHIPYTQICVLLTATSADATTISPCSTIVGYYPSV